MELAFLSDIQLLSRSPWFHGVMVYGLDWQRTEKKKNIVVYCVPETLLPFGMARTVRVSNLVPSAFETSVDEEELFFQQSV